jgi:hypothetical protein
MENKNTPEYLQKTTCVLLENLRNIAGGAAPSVAMTHCTPYKAETPTLLYIPEKAGNMPVVSSKEEMEPEDADKRTSPTFNGCMGQTPLTSFVTSLFHRPENHLRRRNVRL